METYFNWKMWTEFYIPMIIWGGALVIGIFVVCAMMIDEAVTKHWSQKK